MGNSKLKSMLPETALDYRRRVCVAMNFISQNLAEELSLEDIAKSAAFSMFHFHRIFKAVVGETVSEFTRRLRLEQAANRLMSNPQDNITKIAMACGFSSSQNFAKTFRQHFQMTPSEYRISKIGNKESKLENALSLRVSYSLDVVLENESHFARKNEVNAEVIELPEIHVAYIRKLGPYGKETCEAAFGELGQWAGPKGFFGTGTMLGVYWDNPEITPVDKCRTDACISVPEGTRAAGAIAFQKIHGGSYAVCKFELKTESFQQAWEDAFKWLVDSGYQADEKPAYERYHTMADHHPEGKWVFDICIPLKA